MAPKVILVADCHDDSRIIYSTILQYGGFVVLEARSGAEALAMVPQYKPDAVITELVLPVVDGGELVRRLKGHPLTESIPVVVVTSDIRPEQRQEVEGACDAFVLKPCMPRKLLQVVREVLDRQTTPDALL